MSGADTSPGIGGFFGGSSPWLGSPERPPRRDAHSRDDSGSFDGDAGSAPFPAPMGIPLFAVDKTLAVQPRSKPGGERARHRRRDSGDSGAVEGAASPSKFLSGIFGGVGDDADVAAAEARSSRREFVAATCTSASTARPGDPPPPRAFHAAAHCSEEGAKHHLLLRAAPLDAKGRVAEPAPPPALRALPWYDGQRSRITAMEFSPGPLHERLLCGTAGGGVYVIPSAAFLDPDQTSRGEGEGEGEGEGAAAAGERVADANQPSIAVLCSAGPEIVSALWWRRRRAPPDHPSPPSPVAIACASSGEIRLWDGDSGAPLCAVFVGGRVDAAALVDGGDAWGQRLLISGAPKSADESLGSGAARGWRDAAHWTLALERGGESLPDAAGKPGFAPAPLADGRFGVGGADEEETPGLSAHAGADAGEDAGEGGGCLIACLRRRLGTLTLYRPRDDARAVETLAVPPGTVAALVTRRLVFALHRRPGGRARVSALGRRRTKPEDDAASVVYRPAVLQELVLSASIGRPLALARCHPPALALEFARGGGAGAPSSFGLEECAVFAQGAVLRCRAALPSAGTVFRGLLGVAEGAEAEAFAKARRLGRDKEASSARAEYETEDGEAKAAALAAALGTDAAPVYLDAARRAARRGDLGRAKALFRRVEDAPASRFVAACLGEWRAAEALDALRADANSAASECAEHLDPETLRLCCSAHLELSSWAAATAAAAIGAAGEFAEDHPEAALPWPKGALSPADAAEAAGALARACLAHSRDHAMCGQLARASRASRVAADAAAGITAFVEACVRAGADAPRRLSLAADGEEEEDADGEEEEEDDEDAALRSRREAARSSLRAMLAAGLAAEVMHRGGDATAPLIDYATPPTGLGGLVEDGLDGGKDDVARFDFAAAAGSTGPLGAALVALHSALEDPPGSPVASDDSEDAALAEARGASAVLPLLTRADDLAALARGARRASLSSSGRNAAAEVRVAALLALIDAKRSDGSSPDSRREAQRSLEAALGRGLRSGAVRVSWAARACSARANARAEAVVFSHAGEWLAATRSRLRAIASAPRTEACDARVEAELEAILSECAAKAEGAGARADAVAAVAGAWLERGFSLEALERLLIVTVAGTDSGNLEEEGGGTSVEALLTLVRRRAFPFSARFALTVASLRVASLEDSRAVANRVSARTAWTRVKSDVAKGLDAASAIRHARADARWVFSCGHALDAEAARTEPKELARRCEDAGMRVAGALAEAEYALAKVALACPRCAEKAMASR